MIGTLLGETPVGMGVAAVVAAAFSLWRRSIRPAVFFAVLVAGIGGFYYLATTLITRQRPPVHILDPGLVPDASFPSGHVATAVTVYGGTALLCWWLAPRTRPWVWVLVLLPVFVVLARLYQGAHHLTDVLTSVCYASAWLAVVTTVLLRGSSAATGAAGDHTTDVRDAEGHEHDREAVGEGRHDAVVAGRGLDLDVGRRDAVGERESAAGGRDDRRGDPARPGSGGDRLHP